MSEARYSKFATIPVSRDAGHLIPTDHEAFEFHDSEKLAQKAVTEGLASGDKIIALLRVEGLFRIKAIEVEEIK